MADKTSPPPLDAHGIEIVRGMAIAATEPALLSIDTTGLGDGLPATVVVGFDRAEQRFLSLRDRIEEFRVAPARRKGTANAFTLASFVDLVNRHKDERSALFGKTSWPAPALLAVLDYDDATGVARNRQHRIAYAFPLTDEFKAWVTGNATTMDQETFAAFVEEHAAELAAPMDGERSFYEPLFKETFATPTELLSLSRHLEVYVNAKAKQGVRLQTGERVIEFAEEHANAKGEKVTIPGIFMIALPAFVDGEAVRIPARLRYRISGGDIRWFYQLYRWENFLREQVGRDLKDAAERTGLPAFEGAPEA